MFSEVLSLLDLHLFFSKTNLVFFWIRWVWIGMHPHPVCQWPPGWHYMFRLRDSFWTFICHQISTSSHYLKSRFLAFWSSDTVCFCLPDHFLRQYFHRTFTAVSWYHSLFSPGIEWKIPWGSVADVSSRHGWVQDIVETPTPNQNFCTSH